MTKLARLVFDKRTNKWQAKYEGRLLMQSINPNHIKAVIAKGHCNKANAIGVTGIFEDNSNETVAALAAPPPDRFNINERFDFLTDLVKMVATRTMASLIVTGEGGLGKTYTVNRTLDTLGMQNAADLVGFSTDEYLTPDQSKKLFTVVKGYSTAKGLYRSLYENRNRLIIFDDCDSILKDDVALNLLKGALDSYDKRVISWNAESFGKDDDLPRSFEFKGGIIFISNMPLHRIDQAVRSRSLCVDLSMTLDQKIERMGAIIKSDEFLPDYSATAKQAALAFIGEMKTVASEISLRTLISVTKVAQRGGEWKRLAEYVLTAAN